jgi:hypothetical protein
MVSSAWAVEGGWRMGSPRYVMPGAQPAPRMVPQYVNPYHPGHTVGVPTFRWGYFGARSHGQWSCHRRYYGEKDWIWRR